MKGYIKYMSKEPNYDTKDTWEDKLNGWLGITFVTMLMLYLLRWPILFLIFLFS